ncbi:leucine-rich repeat-containing protein 23-like isoform X1 [Cydia pomonella]|uniref:leucine-rich repeat-containing protein 23-like isoform X1 n=1 Tax=Cydia pomonella TaxID=82600 RepID=UPI002ADE4016|nr:leucine-rich repeat-containing protein 23-like isoform X1 [Cydia pomonella]
MLKSRLTLTDAKKEEAQEATTAEVGEEEQGTEERIGEEIFRLPEYAERRLNRSEVSVRMSLLGKTAEGDGYTYLKATITNLNLTEISAIKSFQHLQFLDVSNNHLQTKALEVIKDLPFLVLIQADRNLLTSAALPRMKYLQVMIMNGNYLKSVHDVYQPELSTLEAADNKIDKIHFVNRMPTIRCLDFRHNLIQDISNLNFPNLDSLYLAGNKITSLVGVENLANLRILHVRGNPIKLLTGFSEANEKLEYINLRACKVRTLIQVKKLKVLPNLQTLIMKGCPFMGGTGDDDAGGEEDDAGIRVEILATLPRLKRINKGVVTPEERTEAKDLMVQWLEEGKEDEEELPEEANEEHEED